MIRFCVLASGSKGNAVVVQSEGSSLLIDCGLSFRELSKRLQSIGLSLKDIDALLITHFHSDHVKGLSSLLEKSNIDVFTSHYKYHSDSAKFFRYNKFEELEIGSFKVVPLPLPHDGGGSHGFVFQNDGLRFVYATDLGFPTLDLAAALQDADATIIESNHDLKMLAECSYPDYIKARIRSDHGHLSNCQCADLLNKNLSRSCQQVVLAHLSEKANHPAQALATIGQAITTKTNIAEQHSVSCWYQIQNPSSAFAAAV